MGRPRNEQETKQLSIKMPASERQRLLEVAFHASGELSMNPDEFNLSQWVRERLDELMDQYEAQVSETNGRAVVQQTYRDAVRRHIAERLASIEQP